MPKSHGKLDIGCLIGIGIIASVIALVSGAWYLLSFVFKPSTGFLLFDSVSGLCFGLATYQMMAQSRPYRGEAISRTSTLKAIGMGVVSGLAFLVGGIVLGMLYARVEPPAGEFSLEAFVVRVLAGAIMSAAVGATFYLPLVGNHAVTFIDYQGIPLYFTGLVGGCVGAVIGATNSTQAVTGWIKILVAMGSGVVGAVMGLLMGFLFATLFSRIYTWGRDDTVVAPVEEDEFQKIFLGKNGSYRMNIHPTMLGRIRYLAAYRAAPESAITRVKRIWPSRGADKDEYILYLKSPSTAIGPIRLVTEGGKKAPRRPCYTTRAQLQKARNLDEAF
jgi:hypothetical protein